MNEIKLFIEGQFLDSYIYSGNLFLLDEDYFLNIYKWDRLVDIATLNSESDELAMVLRDSTCSCTIDKKEREVIITSSDLKSSCNLQLSLEFGLQILMYLLMFYIYLQKMELYDMT
ncbi:hypothetical protein [Psychromonas sp. KJ10-2]|uniref:hypothetical protein n=1 Tax=Psychromonas sp. KJ10-2 TaxID=3391822 RepID=UPI0039B3C8BE